MTIRKWRTVKKNGFRPPKKKTVAPDPRRASDGSRDNDGLIYGPPSITPGQNGGEPPFSGGGGSFGGGGASSDWSSDTGGGDSGGGGGDGGGGGE